MAHRYTGTDGDKKAKASAMARSAKRSGKLIAKPCQMCETTVRVQMHHPDYDKPLEVIWLCQSCHLRIHGLEKWLKENSWATWC